jgi:ATP-dependent DNA ligase
MSPIFASIAEDLQDGPGGIVSKRLSARYRSGSSRDWIKVKNPGSPAMMRAREGDW